MVNKVILIGRLWKDPEIVYANSGTAIAKVALATSEKRKDQSGQYVEKTEWHNLVMFGKLADVVGQYMKKGSQAYFEGRLETEKWEKDGVTRYTTKVIVNQMEMLGSREGQERPPSRTPQSSRPAPPDYDDEDNSIPF